MDKLKAMATFIEVGRWRSLARAAKELGVSRPLVSHQLRMLEQQLGMRLVNRTSRQFSLTEVGAQYLELCKTVVAQVEEKEALLSRFHSSPRGTLRIVSSLAFGNYELGPIAAAFMMEYPEISVTLVVTDNYISRRQLADQSFDIAFVMDRVEDSATTVTTVVGAIQWLPCASERYLETHHPIVKPEDLTAHNCLSHRSFVPPDVWRFKRDGDTVSVPIRGSMFSNSVMVLRAGVRAGLGVSILPLYCIQDDLDRGEIVQILSGYETAPKPVYALYPHSTMPQKSRLFVEYCRSRLKRSLALE
ncbi:MAG: LysR family transcriptional regulator [Beijerinckiaceae bacterium]